MFEYYLSDKLHLTSSLQALKRVRFIVQSLTVSKIFSSMRLTLEWIKRNQEKNDPDVCFTYMYGHNIVFFSALQYQDSQYG